MGRHASWGPRNSCEPASYAWTCKTLSSHFLFWKACEPGFKTLNADGLRFWEFSWNLIAGNNFRIIISYFFFFWYEVISYFRNDTLKFSIIMISGSSNVHDNIFILFSEEEGNKLVVSKKTWLTQSLSNTVNRKKMETVFLLFFNYTSCIYSWLSDFSQWSQPFFKLILFRAASFEFMQEFYKFSKFD